MSLLGDFPCWTTCWIISSFMLDPFLLGPGITRLSVRVTRSVRRVARSARRAGELRYECFLLTGIVSETVSCLFEDAECRRCPGGFQRCNRHITDRDPACDRLARRCRFGAGSPEATDRQLVPRCSQQGSRPLEACRLRRLCIPQATGATGGGLMLGTSGDLVGLRLS